MIKARAAVPETETATDTNPITNTLASAVAINDTTITLTSATEFPKTGSITISADATPNAAENFTVTAKTGQCFDCYTSSNHRSYIRHYSNK